VHEKYLALARDAGSAGDRIAAENYLQHAEHYFRIINMDSDGDSQGRGRSQPNGGGGRPERWLDGPDAQDPMFEMHGEAADGAAAAPVEPVAAKSNGAEAETGAASAGPDAAEAAPAPKRRAGRGNGKGRRTRAASNADGASGDGALGGTNAADGDAPPAEE